MATSEVLDEILALKSIFCNPGEFYLINPSSLDDIEETQGPISFKIVVKCHPEQDLTGVANSSENGTATSSFSVEMTVSLQPDYPGTLPDISLSCMGMTKKSLSSLKSNLIEYASSLLTTSSEAIIMDLTIWLQENARSFLDKVELNSKRKMPTESKFILLLKLDHMRNKSRYIRTIARWVDELKLTGRIFFAGYLIFLLLTGTAESVKEYLRRHKTCNVDIDSSGKPCKEKMMNILMHEQDLINLRYEINEDVSRLEHTRRQVAVTLCGDRSLLEYKVGRLVVAKCCGDMSHRQIALHVLENFNENLCLHN